MRKILLVVTFAMVGFTMQAQKGFKLGANVGLPAGMLEISHKASAGIDLMYHWNIANGFDLGVATGYVYYFGKSDFEINGFEVEVKDFDLIPLAASGQFALSERFRLRADAGYAFGIKKGDVYFKPSVGYSIGKKVELNLSYTFTGNDDLDIGTGNFGILFLL